MKLIYAIISDDDVKSVTGELNQEGFYATRLSSSGSFLRSGNTTLMICTEDELVDQAISIIKEKQLRAQNAGAGLPVHVRPGNVDSRSRGSDGRGSYHYGGQRGAV